MGYYNGIGDLNGARVVGFKGRAYRLIRTAWNYKTRRWGVYIQAFDCSWEGWVNLDQLHRPPPKPVYQGCPGCQRLADSQLEYGWCAEEGEEGEEA